MSDKFGQMLGFVYISNKIQWREVEIRLNDEAYINMDDVWGFTLTHSGQDKAVASLQRTFSY